MVMPTDRDTAGAGCSVAERPWFLQQHWEGRKKGREGEEREGEKRKGGREDCSQFFSRSCVGTGDRGEEKQGDPDVLQGNEGNESRIVCAEDLSRLWGLQTIPVF